MKRTHSWKWLAPRFTRCPSRGSGGKQAANRPCLDFERLEDRVLLSASQHAVEPPPPTPTGDTEVVVSLVNDSLKVTQDEFTLLMTLSQSTTTKTGAHDIQVVKTTDKSTPILFQLDSQLIKIGEDLIKGQLTDRKMAAAENKVKYLEFKLKEVIISSIAPESQEQVMSILNNLFADVNTLIQNLVSFEGPSRATHKQMLDFIKISQDVLKVQELTIKGELDFIKDISPGQDVQNFQHKIDVIFSKVDQAIAQLGEEAASVLLPAVQNFQTGITELLGSLSDGGDFGGGVGLPGGVDDIIS